MKVWKTGSIKFDFTETRVNKEFQRTVNEMCFMKKNTFILPYFHSSILVFDISKFFIRMIL